MRTPTLLLIAALAAPAVATLPPPSEEAKAQAAAAKAKSDWGDKVAAYKLCREQDRLAAQYRATRGQESKTPTFATPPCVDPGPFAAAAAKPLEAAGAHSPPMTAASPPNTKTPHAELAGAAKK